MKTVVLSLLLVSAFSAYAATDNHGWEASVTLSTIQNLQSKVPDTLVPKQSIQMTATVWMPEKVNWFPQYPQWDMPGATIVPLFMLSPSIERPQGKVTQRGATQNYLLTPLAEGTLTLHPSSITLYPDEKDSPVLSVDPVSVDVELPVGAGDIAHFFPASGVKLTQSWYLMSADKTAQELDPAALKTLTLKSGQQLERRVLIEAGGIQGKLIPALNADPLVSQNEPEVTDLMNYDEFIGGTRTEHWYYAPQPKEKMHLSDIRVRWYDTAQQQFRTAELSGLSLNSDVQNETKPAIPLTLRERISLLPARFWQYAGLCAGLLLVGGVCHRRIWRQIRQTGKAGMQLLQHSAWIQLVCLALCIAVLGGKSPWIRRRYQRWSLRFMPQRSSPDSLKTWFAATYAKDESVYPGRLVIIRALFAQYLTATLEKRERRDKGYELPEIVSSSVTRRRGKNQS